MTGFEAEPAAASSEPKPAKLNRAATNIQKLVRGRSARHKVWVMLDSLWDIKSEFEQEGWCKNFEHFNEELVAPLKRLHVVNTTKSNNDAAETVGVGDWWEALKTSEGRAALLRTLSSVRVLCSAASWKRLCKPIVATLPNPFRPTTDNSRKVSFVLWNVLCFWLGVIELMLFFLLKTEFGLWGWLIVIVDGLLGYLFAYTFYFIFVSYAKREWMGRGLGALLVYVAATAYLTYEGLTDPTHTHIDRAEGIANGLKAFANAVAAFHAWQIVRHSGHCATKMANAARALRWAKGAKGSASQGANGARSMV